MHVTLARAQTWPANHSQRTLRSYAPAYLLPSLLLQSLPQARGEKPAGPRADKEPQSPAWKSAMRRKFDSDAGHLAHRVRDFQTPLSLAGCRSRCVASIRAPGDSVVRFGFSCYASASTTDRASMQHSQAPADEP